MLLWTKKTIEFSVRERRFACISRSYCRSYYKVTRTMISSDEQTLGVFERKILCKIYGPFCYRGEWRIRWNQELYDIYDHIDVVKRIKIQRIRWLGHFARMDSSNPVRKVLESESGGESRRKGRPRQRWTKQVNENATTLGIRNWCKAATARDVWRRNLAEAKTCNRF